MKKIPDHINKMLKSWSPDDALKYELFKDSVLATLKEQIKSEVFDDFKSWDCQVGVLLTKQEAQFVYDLLQRR